MARSQKEQTSNLKTAKHRVKQANNFLYEECGIRMKIHLIGQRLYIRKVLPPRPESERTDRHQQVITLGLNADQQGIQQAIQDVRELSSMLSQRKFNWKTWRQYLGDSYEPRKSQTETIRTQVEKFKAYFLTLPKQKISREDAWKTQWSHYFKKLPFDEYLTDKIMLDAIYEKTEEGSCCRKKFCLRLKAFIEFLDFKTDLDLVAIGKAYNGTPVNEDELPTDQEILDALDLITVPEWRTAYLLQAIFGLRNHEIFFLDRDNVESYEGIKVLKVAAETKTGFRAVAALYPEWFDNPEWNLQTAKLPDINLDLSKTTLSKIGDKVTRAFKKFGIPFTPYALRHAWARRAMEFGLSDEAAAEFMGHNLVTHQKHYQRLIALKHGLRIVQSFMANSNRPKPPQKRGS